MKYLSIIFLFVFSNLQGQEIKSYTQSPEAITDKMLEIISGEIGEERDWDTFRDLFAEDAHFFFPPSNGKRKIMTMDIEEFIKRVGPMYKKDGFEEISLGNTIHQFNGMALVFQSYTCKNLRGTYQERGINNYQLVYAQKRWWIVSCTFANETKDSLIPEHYIFEKSEE